MGWFFCIFVHDVQQIMGSSSMLIPELAYIERACNGLKKKQPGKVLAISSSRSILIDDKSYAV